MNIFPDGTNTNNWFNDNNSYSLSNLGKKYFLYDYVKPNQNIVLTEKIQELINSISNNGGGVLIISKGIYLSGALFFKQGVNLYIEKDGLLKGSDNIKDYPLMETRIEGETCLYYPALVNADGVDGFVISGKGTIDGNGEKSWIAFWKRLEWNKNATNKDEQRPRLLYISNSKNIVISGITLQNSCFWTTHIYKCQYVKYLNCVIRSPHEPIPSPSTDAIDIDACKDVLIKGCDISVNDDAIALKGGKGPNADKDLNNGENERIIIEDTKFGFCHSCLTCGSESIYNKNIILRNSTVDGAQILLRFKIRPDTPQHFEFVKVENVKGNVGYVIYINSWTQFFDLKGQNKPPVAKINNIHLKDLDIKAEQFALLIRNDEQYKLKDFIFENIKIDTNIKDYDKDAIDNLKEF